MVRAWCLGSRPEGLPSPANFVLRDFERPRLGPGEVRVRNQWLSVDPSMRVRMDAGEGDYMPPFELNAPLTGGAIGEVIETNSPHFTLGELVNHMEGWRDESVVPESGVRRLPPVDLPIEFYLHHLGVVGFTAYVGLLKIAQARPGETVFISAAGGSVGLAAVQIAKIKGLTVIGSAGGAKKCEVVRGAGADAVIDYKSSGAILGKLRAAAPEGIDIYFDNVGGDHLDAALAVTKVNGRMAISGMVGAYNDVVSPMVMRHLLRIVTHRIAFKGFMARDYSEDMPAFRVEMTNWIREGRMQIHQTIRHGLEAAPAAFIEMFTGDVIGKMLVQI